MMAMQGRVPCFCFMWLLLYPVTHGKKAKDSGAKIIVNADGTHDIENLDKSSLESVQPEISEERRQLNAEIENFDKSSLKSATPKISEKRRQPNSKGESFGKSSSESAKPESLVSGPKRNVGEVKMIVEALSNANIDVSKGFSKAAWLKAFDGKLEAAVCGEEGCLTKALGLDAAAIFDIMDIDWDDEVHGGEGVDQNGDSVPILRALALLSKKGVGKIEVNAIGQSGGKKFTESERQAFTKDLKQVFMNAKPVKDPDSELALTNEKVSNLLKEKGSLLHIIQKYNLQLPEGVMKQESGALFSYILDVDEDKYVHAPDFVPIVRMLTKVKFSEINSSLASPLWPCWISLVVLVQVALFQHFF